MSLKFHKTSKSRRIIVSWDYLPLIYLASLSPYMYIWRADSKPWWNSDKHGHRCSAYSNCVVYVACPYPWQRQNWVGLPSQGHLCVSVCACEGLEASTYRAEMWNRLRSVKENLTYIQFKLSRVKSLENLPSTSYLSIYLFIDVNTWTSLSMEEKK